MDAAVVNSSDRPPVVGKFPDPEPAPGDERVAVTAAALRPLVHGQASGKHDSSGRGISFVPGVDGVGTDGRGRRVYFAFPKSPWSRPPSACPCRSI